MERMESSLQQQEQPLQCQLRKVLLVQELEQVLQWQVQAQQQNQLKNL